MKLHLESYTSTLVAKVIVIGFMTFVGFFTPITLTAQLIGLPFRVYGVFGSIAGAVGLASMIYVFFKQSRQIRHRDSMVLCGLLFAGVIGAILTLVVHLENADDYFYVPNAVYFLQHPSEAMDFRLHFFVTNGEPVITHSQGTSLAYDYLRAVIAHHFNFNYLTVYHIVSAAIVGFMIPLAHFLLVSHFSDDTTHALVGTFTSMAILMILIETHRTFGNFAFPRLFQGKAVLLSLGIPAFAAFSISYLIEPTPLRWVVLFMTVVAMVGTTTSAVVLLPMLSVVLMIAFAATSIERGLSGLTRIITYLASTGYAVFHAIFLATQSKYDVGINSPMNQGWPVDFMGHALFLIDAEPPIKPVTPILMIFSTILAIWLLNREHRRFIAVWIGALLVLFLNPIVAPFIIKYVTTPNMYWRLFYLYPFPLVTSAVASSLSARAAERLALWQRFGIAGAILLVGMLYQVENFSVHGKIGWPGYKLPPRDLRVARAVLAVAPKGVMFAPDPLFGVIPMLDSSYPQILVRNDGLNLWLSQKESELRQQAARFAGGNLGSHEAFQRLLEENLPLKTVVLWNKAYNDPAVQEMLREHHFVNHQTVEGYVVLWK